MRDQALILGNLLKWCLQGRKTVRNDTKTSYCEVCMLWFSFIRGLNFVFLCFKLIIIHYHTQNPHEINLKQKIKIEPQNEHLNGCLRAFLPFYRTHDKLPYTSFQYYWLQGGCCESGSPVIDMSRSGGAASIRQGYFAER